MHIICTFKKTEHSFRNAEVLMYVKYRRIV